MGPWSDSSSFREKQARTIGLTEWVLITGVLALCVFAGLAVWANRYEVGTTGGLPTRLDRFTGQVIGCLPGQGCVEFIPAGEPALRRAVLHSGPPPSAAAAGNAPAGDTSPTPVAKP